MKIRKILITCLLLVFSLLLVSCAQGQGTYNIKFVDYDNTLLLELTLNEGEMPVYSLENPSRENTAQYTYTFLGWDKFFEPATEDLTYKAVYLERVNVYNVKFVDDDGTVLQEMDLQYGQMPEYTLKNPLKESNVQYTYHFDGWDKEVEAVSEDTTYTAVYSTVTNAYKVSFLDLQGNVLYENNFEYGTTPSYSGVEPTLEGNAQYSYLFSGWDKEVTPVTGNIIYRPQFEQVVNEYTITFLDSSNQVLQETSVPYGTIPIFSGTLPNVPGNDAQYSYEAAWDKEVVAVIGDATYKFVVNQTVNKYTVKFVNEDGSLLSEKEYEYGQTPVYDLETPVKENTVEYGYEFLNWDKEIETVVGDVTYKAVFKATKAKYLVTFLDEAGNELQSSLVEYGVVPTYTGEAPLPDSDVQFTYSGEWDKEFAVVEGETTYTYIINKVVNKYDVTINHLNLDGTVALAPYTANLAFNELESYKGYYSYTAPLVEGKVPSHD